MNVKLIRPDIDGNLVRCEDSAEPQFIKQLSTSVGWHIHDPQNLADLPGKIVESILTNVTEGVYQIWYGRAVEPLDLDGLRDLLLPDGFFGPWRVAKLAETLCQEMKTLHVEDIPQLIVHPERVARAGDRIVLLPSMAGILPPLAQMPPNQVAGWLHYVAPESLRTRGIEKQLLFAGDVYALGRMLHLLCIKDWQPAKNANPLEMARRRVENPSEDALPPLPTEYAPLEPIIAAMCSLHPDDRPSLELAQQDFSSLVAQLDPERGFAELLQEKGIDPAEKALKELQATTRAQVFGFKQRTIHLLNADLAMARTPPDCGRAIMELDKAEHPTEYEGDVQYRLGKAYAKFTGNPQHLQLSCKSFERAAGLLRYPPEVLDQWVQVLHQLDEPQAVLELLDSIPDRFRTRGAAVLRLECLLHMRAYLDAWLEVSSMLAKHGMDSQLVSLAIKVGKQNDDLELVKWAHRCKGRAGYEVPLGIAWLCAGNYEEAEKYLGEAIHLYRTVEGN